MVLTDRVRFPVPLFIYAKWGVSMYFEFVYVGYSTKQCVEFIDGIEEKLKAHDKNFEYDKEHLVIKAELFKCSALPIDSGCLSCLGMEMQSISAKKLYVRRIIFQVQKSV